MQADKYIENYGGGRRNIVAIPVTTEINPRGADVGARLEELIRQLRIQNTELKLIVNDIYGELETLKTACSRK